MWATQPFHLFVFVATLLVRRRWCVLHHRLGMREMCLVLCVKKNDYLQKKRRKSQVRLVSTQSPMSRPTDTYPPGLLPPTYQNAAGTVPRRWMIQRLGHEHRELKHCPVVIRMCVCVCAFIVRVRDINAAAAAGEDDITPPPPPSSPPPPRHAQLQGFAVSRPEPSPLPSPPLPRGSGASAWREEGDVAVVLLPYKPYFFPACPITHPPRGLLLWS